MVYNKKQRIVGTIVLMALVGLLFPVIFDGGDTFQAELESRIPPEPQFSLLPEPNPTRPVIIADADTDDMQILTLVQRRVNRRFRKTIVR